MDIECEIEDCKNKVPESILTRCTSHSDPCPICLVNLGIDDETARLYCGHMYHACCIYKWFDVVIACPMCRA